MSNEKLFYKLLKSETEKEVIEVLKEAGYWEEKFDSENSAWRLLGDKENNFATVNGQTGDPTGAIVEKLVNSMDAMLISRCLEEGIDPRSPDSPQSMSEAVEKFFDVKDGSLQNLDPREQTKLAENIQFIATGSKGKERKNEPCYMIVDKGEGQSPKNMHETILSIEKTNKKAIRFVQGQFNQGGTAVIQFCGNEDGHNLQLIASKRNPKLLKNNEDSRWSFTVIRRFLSTENEDNTKYSVFTYLAPNQDLLILDDEKLKVLPDSSANYKPYIKNLSWGTVIKLYEYQWDGMGSSVILDPLRTVNKNLLQSPLPVRFIESRGFKAHTNASTMVGLWNRKTDDMEEGYPASGVLKVKEKNIGVIPLRWTVFKEGTTQREIESGVFITVNGQTHGDLGGTFVSNVLKLPHLDKYLSIDLDITNIDSRRKEDYIKTDRSNLRNNSTHKAIREAVKKEFQDNSKLKELNNLRKTKKQKEKLEQSGVHDKLVSELLSKDKNFHNLLTGDGSFISKITRVVTESSAFVGTEFPSFFYFTKNKKNKYTHKSPLNKEPRVSLTTDVENDYFTRSAIKTPGYLKFSNSDLVKSQSLEDGRLNLVLQFPENAKVGDKFKLEILIGDESNINTFKNILTIEALKKSKSNGQTSDKKKTKKDSKGKENQPTQGIPEPMELSHIDGKENSADSNWDWNSYTSLELRGDDWYLNIDNIYFQTEINNHEDSALLYKSYFKYGLLFAGLTIKNRLEEEKIEEEDVYKIINQSLRGLAASIIPILRLLPENKLDQ